MSEYALDSQNHILHNLELWIIYRYVKNDVIWVI